MKKLLVLGLLAGLVFSACSNDNDISVNGNENEYHMVAGQPAYISLGIAMPSDPATRANDTYDDGAAAEYQVASGLLVLFKGTEESTATIFASYDIKDAITSWSAESRDQVTTTSNKFVQAITSPDLVGAQKVFAYVILNNKDNATGIDASIGTTFDNFGKQVFKAIGIADESKGYGAEGSNKFVMTNTPYCTEAGGSAAPAAGAKIQTLTVIEPEAIYDTYEEANSSDADVACIYVERAAVKVELVSFSSTIADPARPGVSGAYATLEKWALGNVNNNGTYSGYYNTRQVKATWNPYFNAKAATASTKYRFVSVQPFFAAGDGHDMGYRTYWAEDVNYDGRTGLIDGKVAETKHTLNPPTSLAPAITYTYENTFDEDNQIYANTTYMSFQTKLNGGTTFYTVEPEKNKAYITPEALKAHLEIGIDAFKATALTTLRNNIKAAIDADLDDPSSTIRAAAHIGPSDPAAYDLTYVHDITLGSRDDDTGIQDPYSDKYIFKNIAFNGSPASDDVKDAINALTIPGGTISSVLATDLDLTGYTQETVNEYATGITYYAARIAHFGDAETPWSTDASSYNNYSKIYPTTGISNEATPVTYATDTPKRANAWLGRWGIVRNNWYAVSVTNIKGIGSAVPVDFSDSGTGKPGATPDDNPDPVFIAAHVHIIPWVKRTQSVILK